MDQNYLKALNIISMAKDELETIYKKANYEGLENGMANNELENIIESLEDAKQEIEYRKTKTPGLTPEKVLQDTIGTCLIIAKRGRGTSDEKLKFISFVKYINLPKK